MFLGAMNTIICYYYRIKVVTPSLAGRDGVGLLVCF